MAEKFVSKKDLSLLLPVVVIFVIVMILLLWPPVAWIPLLVVFLGALYFIQMWAATYYIISEKELIINCGLFYRKTIAVADIERILPIKSMESAPALSFDRLEISFGNKQKVLISPMEQRNFTNRLQEMNPQIVIKS